MAENEMYPSSEHSVAGLIYILMRNGEEKENTLQPSKPMDACNEMKMRLFAMKEQVMYRDDQDRYDRLFQEYEKLCSQR